MLSAKLQPVFDQTYVYHIAATSHQYMSPDGYCAEQSTKVFSVSGFIC